jgi:hypothetical protein
MDSIGFDDNGFIVEMPGADQLLADVERSIRSATETEAASSAARREAY